jgi:eukaryotic-like serine/threonine-protein kinase
MGLSIPQMALMSRLLDEALPLDAQGRRRWLDALPPEHQSLAQALREALLPAGEGGLTKALERSPGDDLNRIRVGPQPGELLGPYRVIRLIGEGGMAQVWLARRADGAFKRDVALKLPTLLGRRKDLAGRFARERDILAALEHPNIARLYDAGVSADGLPYLAMEYIAGEPLTTWCDARQLGVRERLRLFLQVLDAVQYAHVQRVLHRDIKPSNILVSDSGQVRLLDFGVAKLLTPEEKKKSDLTQRYGRVLTPDYASPEQVRGEELGTASDVYALGVLLYELLTGNRPYHLETEGSIAKLEGAITRVEVQRPSVNVATGAGPNRGTTDGKLARRLRGDLDAIVLKALAKTPSDRYESAAAFADDLLRTLKGEPVEARPDRLGYRFGKFVLRHRTGFAMSVVIVALFAAALGYVLRHSHDTHALATTSAVSVGQGKSAAAAEDKSIAVLPFTDMSQNQDEEYFSDGLSEELIDHLVHSADLKVIARTSSFQFKGKNEDVRSIAHKLGVTHVLEGSVRKDGQQVRISAQLIRASDGVHLWSQTYDRNLVDIFKVQDDIAEEVSRALSVALLSGHQAGSREPDVRAYNLVLEGNYFKARRTLADVEKSAQLYQQAIDINPDYALAWARLASAYLREEILRGPQAEDQNRRILAALERAIQLDPKLAWSYYTRGGFEMEVTWNWAAAQAATRRLHEIDPQFQLLPSAIGDLAILFGDADLAVESYERSLTRNPLDPNTLDAVGFALCAADRFQDCLETRLKLMQLQPQFDGVESLVGTAHLYLGQFNAALAAMQQEPNEDYRLRGLAIVYCGMGRHTESLAALNSLTEKFASSDAYGIAEVHAYCGQIDDAFQWLERAYRGHDFGMPAVKMDPLLRNLRKDPRFQALLTRMGIAGGGQPEGRTPTLEESTIYRALNQERGLRTWHHEEPTREEDRTNAGTQKMSSGLHGAQGPRWQSSSGALAPAPSRSWSWMRG